MYFSAFTPIILLLLFTERIVADDDQCLQDFKKLGYVTKFADIVKSSNLQVEYAGKNISCGSTANIVQTLDPPTLYYKAPSCCKNITVLALFPDTTATSTYTIWSINNIPPENLWKGFTTGKLTNTDNNGDYACKYETPSSVSGSAVPRSIVTFVYCQCGYVDDDTFYGPTVIGKANFDVKGYAKKYHLGNPMAGHYFYFTAGVDLKNVTKGVIPQLTLI